MALTAAAMAALRADRKAKGFCTECDTKRLPDHSLCKRHHDLRAKRLKVYNEKRTREGRCYCGDRVKPGRDRCAVCLAIEVERRQVHYAARLAAQQCVSCGRKPRKGKVECTHCATKAARYYQAGKQRRIFRVQRKGQLARALNVTFEARPAMC